MYINGVEIVDTYSEGFSMNGARVLVTAKTDRWAETAATEAAGFATSIIGCGCEAAVEGKIPKTPDKRPGRSILFFAREMEQLEDQLIKRLGNCVLTCVTTACYNGLETENRLAVGKKISFFGDGWQKSREDQKGKFWSIPVMEGEFIIEDSFGYTESGATGNFILLGRSQNAVLEAAEAAVRAISPIEGVILPFPGGIVRSGSKVGSRYSFLHASTFESYCPTLKNDTVTELTGNINAVLEIVLCGLDLESVKRAMKAGIEAACRHDLVRVSAGNYGGKLGKYNVYLREILED